MRKFSKALEKKKVRAGVLKATPAPTELAEKRSSMLVDGRPGQGVTDQHRGLHVI